jgi:hypothetical protein
MKAHPLPLLLLALNLADCVGPAHGPVYLQH